MDLKPTEDHRLSEADVAAFRKALSRRPRSKRGLDWNSSDHGEAEESWDEMKRKWQEMMQEPQESNQEDSSIPSGKAEASRDEIGTETESSTETGSSAETEFSASSRGATVEDTISAFRGARDRVLQQEEDSPTRTDEDRLPSSEQKPEAVRFDRNGHSSEENVPFQLDDSIEDFASAFRRALEQGEDPEFSLADRGSVGFWREKGILERRRQRNQDPEMSLGSEVKSIIQSDDEVPRPEDNQLGRSSTPPQEAETEQSNRPGDGVPFTSKVDVHESVPGGSSGGPSQPETPFLWVTTRPEDEAASISIEHLGHPRALEAEAFLLGGEGKKPHELLRRIRGHSNAKIYLKPVFWVHAEGEESNLADHVDGECTRDERSTFDVLEEQAASINRRIDNIVEGGTRDEGGMELRVLRFMVTRNHEFAPHRTAENSDGFVYPKLTPLLERGSQSRGGELVQILSILEDRRLLSGAFVMSQHACQNCGSGFLNFEEVCSHCGSTHLDTNDLVHHFRCGFTGALDEFDREKGKLICPKCDRYLKQIGVDYDKPSVVHTCQRCHEQFQEPKVQTTCYQCERTSPPEQQIRRQIKTYDVTALGEETATYGLSDSLLSILERESRVLDYATFQLVVDSESARIERYESPTGTLLLVQVTGLQELRKELGRRSREVIEEVATAFDDTLRSSDYLSARDESLYLFLLTETGEKGARRAGERLEQNIESVLRENLERPPTLNIAVQPLRPDIDLDHITDQFLSLQSREQASADPASR